MLLMNRSRWTFRFGLWGGKGIGLIVSRSRTCRNESLNLVQPHWDQGHRRGRRRPAEGVAQLQDREVAVVSKADHAITGVTPRARGGGRGSDLAVTARELNAGAGVGRLGCRVRAWGDVMRVLLAVLLVGGMGCGGNDNSPIDAPPPSSPEKAENAVASDAKKSVEGQETLTLKGHSGPVTSVSFSPDGKRIVSGSPDKTVKV